MSIISPEKVFLHHLELPVFSERKINVSILRLDLIHPLISGNKWFKLAGYIKDSSEKGYIKIATFGGAYSNHILATAAYCYENGLQSIGFIRGEEPSKYSNILEAAMKFNMHLIFLSREEYKNRNISVLKEQYPDYYFIDEGGFGLFGITGIKSIFSWIPADANFIVAACGTGTTLAGLIYSATPQQTIIGINVLKGYQAIENDIKSLFPSNFKADNWQVINDYHFGGYAKKTNTLIYFMNHLWNTNRLPTDFVYESKMMYGLIDLAEKGYFPQNSSVVAIHSGGLQGNKSLPEGTLHF